MAKAMPKCAFTWATGLDTHCLLCLPSGSTVSLRSKQAVINTLQLPCLSWPLLILWCPFAGGELWACLPLLAVPTRAWGSRASRKVRLSELRTRANQLSGRESGHLVHSGELTLTQLSRVLSWSS